MVAAWMLVGLGSAAPLSIDAVPNPRRGGGWVSDVADVLPADREAALERLLQSVHDETGAEVAVVTVHDTFDEPKAFATGLFNHWGIGDARANNGMLVLLVLDRRRLEMETGYGLEAVLTDGWLGGMQAQQMVPHFKAGDYATGLEAGVKASSERLRANAAAVREGATAPPSSRSGASSSSGLGDPTPFLLAGGVGGVGILGPGVWWYLRRRQRTCLGATCSCR